MADYKKLVVWQKAHEIAIDANRVATTIRGSNYAALRSQVIRAAMSVPANIVEGRAQNGEKDFARFLRYAAASASELEYHLMLAHNFGVIRKEEYSRLANRISEVQRMLHGLINRLAVASS